MKIVYIIETLASTGGTERMVSEKANYLSEYFNYDVYIISCTQKQSQENAFKLSNTVEQINLAIPYYSQYRHKYPMRLWIKYSINNRLKRDLTKCIRKINPDFLIGIGHFKADLVCKIKCNAKKIIECHEARPFTLSGMAQHQNTLSKLYTILYRNRYFKTIERSADTIVTLTHGDKLMWNKAKHVVVIPNFSIMPVYQISPCDTKQIIAVGRLSWEKGFDRLLSIWGMMYYRYPEWHLVIFGEGELEMELKTKITKCDIKNITIHHFTNELYKEYAKSSICVMTSYYEGFSLVLLEAIKHGIPCVSFNCPFGPASIIDDNQCGFLIDNGNIHQFAERLSLLIENDILRKDFSKAAVIRSNDFAIDRIMGLWKNLFEKK